MDAEEKLVLLCEHQKFMMFEHKIINKIYTKEYLNMIIKSPLDILV
jgi:hypothetical protein